MSLKDSESRMLGNISVENTEELSLEQIRAFLQASQEVRIEATRREEVTVKRDYVRIRAG